MNNVSTVEETKLRSKSAESTHGTLIFQMTPFKSGSHKKNACSVTIDDSVERKNSSANRDQGP